MSKEIIILGAGSVGGHIVSNLNLYFSKRVKPIFLDDDTTKHQKNFCGINILGSISEIKKFHINTPVIIGIALPNIKLKLYQYLKSLGYTNFPTLVSRNSWISNEIEIGKGSIIYPNCSVNYNTQIGNFVILNMNCAIGHDCTISDYTSLSPGVNLGGNTSIGELCEIGIGASTLQFITINNEAIVGGNCVVVKNVKSNTIVKGVPGR
jgi:sugar O-acyltransferase (sialic acid O-acetyltransferase NeuD family)